MNSSSVQQPMIVKYVESLHNGIRTQVLSRYAIGYILRAEKAAWNGLGGVTFHDLRHNIAWDRLDAPVAVKNRHAVITIDDREINDQMITIDIRHYVPHK